MNLGPYQKTVAALVTGVIGWGFVVVASASAPITAPEWMALAVVAAQAVGVYAVPNGGWTPGEVVRKALAARGVASGFTAPWDDEGGASMTFDPHPAGPDPVVPEKRTPRRRGVSQGAAKPKDSGATDLVAVGLFLLLLAFAYLVLVHAGAL